VRLSGELSNDGAKRCAMIDILRSSLQSMHLIGVSEG
jgi:hypothetical protein